MKFKHVVLPLVFCLVFMSQLFAQQILDDGKTVYFGENIEEAQKVFSVNPVDDSSPIARKGIDKKIQIRGISLKFDTGRLNEIEFAKDYQFKNPTKPYPAAWKNFDAIDDKKLAPGITREEFLAYLDVWEKRANKLGARKVDSEDLNENEYNISTTQNQFMDGIHVSMGPSRKTGRGGRWCDGWSAFFATETDHKFTGATVGRLQSFSAFCDEFNTAARTK